MALFDKVLGQTSQIANSLVGKATTYVVSSATTKVTEATNKIANTLGVNLPFETLGASLPSIKEVTAQAIRAGTSELTSNAFIKQQIDKVTGAMIPSVSAQTMQATAGVEIDPEGHLVTLTRNPADKVKFVVMPQISEQRAVSYEEVQPLQSPTPFQKYRATGATVWTVNALFISRNSQEATENLLNLMRLRGWTKPYFGDNTAANFPGQLGAPPPVLEFNGFRGMLIGPVPVVIQNLTWDWPRDVDYLPTYAPSDDGTGVIPFPAVMSVSISLYESYSPAEVNMFDLAAFKSGDLTKAFSQAINRTSEGQPQ